MAKTKEFKLPKYLKLNKGVMWFDIHGKNPSGIKLYAMNKQLVGRAIHKETSDQEFEFANKREELLEKGKIKEYNELDSYISLAEPAKDEDKDNRAREGGYGWIEMDDKSVFCTTTVSKDKLANIITAFNVGVLVPFDPKKQKAKVTEHKIKKQQKDFVYDEKGDIVFIGKNRAMFQKINNLTQEKIILFIDKCGPSSLNNLMDMYYYEKRGYNNVSRPRFDVLNAIQAKLNTFGPSISPITVDKDDGTDID